MVCDKPGAPVVAKARERGIETFVFSPKDYGSKADYEREIVSMMEARGVELVCLAGYISSFYHLPGIPLSKSITAL